MFAKVFALFAFLAVAFASPNPKPDVLTYAAPGVISAYPGAPVAYSAGYPYAAAGAYPYAASAYPSYGYSAYYVK